MANKILILVGGGTKHLSPFLDATERLGTELYLDSFSHLEYISNEFGELKLTISGKDLEEFDLIYLRLIGKRYEDAALVIYYCKKHNIKIIDSIYEKGLVLKIPIPKSIETKLLIDADIPVPRTYFGRTKLMKEICPKLFGYPFVIKGTTGKQGHAVWSPRDEKELDELIVKFTSLEKNEGVRFIAQEFIKTSQRKRIFVLGEKAIAGITRPTRWRKRFKSEFNQKYPEGIREKLDPIPPEDAELAVNAAKAVGIDIGGVDIITDDFTGKRYVLEVNSAPRWASIKKDTGINVEEEILKYLISI